MGAKYATVVISGYNSSPPPDDGTQSASNLVTWSGQKTKLADPIKTQVAAIDTALVAALNASCRAISSNDNVVAGDHWRTLEVTGTTTVTLLDAATAGAGFVVDIYNNGSGIVTVDRTTATDTINNVSSAVPIPPLETWRFITNSALTGYNILSKSNGYNVQGASISSSSTTNLATATGHYVVVSGTTTITALGTTTAGVIRTVEFSGALTLTHHATSLILPGGANIVTAAGDVAVFISEGSGNWRCLNYRKASGAPVSMTPLVNVLSGDVALNNTGLYFDGPSVAQGTSGTWFASGTVCCIDTAGGATFQYKLWDGTTLIASAKDNRSSTGLYSVVALSGWIASPAGNIRISVQDASSTSGKIVYNDSGNSKDSTISVIRIA